MEIVSKLIVFAQSHQAEVILFALLSVSEALALIPSVQSNSIAQAVFNGVKKAHAWVKSKRSPQA